MAYVVPNSSIYLLSNVPLHPGSMDTFYFDSEAQQQAYFRSKIVYTFNAQSYQRVNSGRIRVQLSPAQNVYQCNYLMFTNSSHWANKFFYAFILRIDYINENCAEITYVLDPIQTWFFQYNEESCLVVRQSPNTDTPGDNLQPEGFDCGTYVQNTVDTPQIGYDGEDGYLGDYIAVLYLNNMQNNDGFLVDGVFSAATLYVYRCTSTGVDLLNQFIDGHISETVDGVTSYYPDNILGIYMLPHEVFPKMAQPANGAKYSGMIGASTRPVSISGRGTSLDGYTPYNKKLLTSPYNMLNVSCGTGQSINYQYEFFDTPTSIRFYLRGNLTPPCSVTVLPENYKNQSGGSGAETLSSGEYPLCSWSTDAWTAWLGQNSGLPLTQTLAEPVVSAFGYAQSVGKQFMSGDIVGAIETIAGSILGINNEVNRQATGSGKGDKSMPLGDLLSKGVSGESVLTGLMSSNPTYRSSDITKGSIYNGSNWYADSFRRYFKFRRMSITREFARKIDSYFDAYGYALNEITQPLRCTRRKYTYVQTKGCAIRGAIPASAQDEISSLYDGGIRFWRYTGVGENIGTYDIANNGIL